MAMFLKLPNEVARLIEAFAQSPCDVEFIHKYGTGIRAHMIDQSDAPADSDLGAMRYIWEVDDLASMKAGMLILVDFAPPRSEWRVKYISSRTADQIYFFGNRCRGWSLDSIALRLYAEVQTNTWTRHFGRVKGYPVERTSLREQEWADKTIWAIIMGIDPESMWAPTTLRIAT